MAVASLNEHRRPRVRQWSTTDQAESDGFGHDQDGAGAAAQFAPAQNTRQADHQQGDAAVLAALDAYLQDFSRDMMLQVESLRSCARQTQRLDLLYRRCAEASSFKLMTAINRFRDDMGYGPGDACLALNSFSFPCASKIVEATETCAAEQPCAKRPAQGCLHITATGDCVACSRPADEALPDDYLRYEKTELIKVPCERDELAISKPQTCLQVPCERDELVVSQIEACLQVPCERDELEVSKTELCQIDLGQEDTHDGTVIDGDAVPSARPPDKMSESVIHVADPSTDGDLLAVVPASPRLHIEAVARAVALQRDFAEEEASQVSPSRAWLRSSLKGSTEFIGTFPGRGAASLVRQVGNFSAEMMNLVGTRRRSCSDESDRSSVSSIEAARPNRNSSGMSRISTLSRWSTEARRRDYCSNVSNHPWHTALDLKARKSWEANIQTWDRRSQRRSTLNAMPPMSLQSSISARSVSQREVNIDIANDDDEDDGATYPCTDGSLNPNWPGRLAWDLFTISLVIADAVILPYQLAYKNDCPPDKYDEVWLHLTTSCFAFDMLINFFTAYPATARDMDFDIGAFVTNKVDIIKNYFRGWFAIDLFSTIPWGIVTSALVGDDATSAGQLGKLTKIVKFARFLRLMRMMKLAKLSELWERVEAKCGSHVLFQAVALAKVILVMICICHWNACIWWMVGQPSSLFTELLSDETQVEWASLPHWTTIQRSVGPEQPMWTWLGQEKSAAYIFCFYWTLGVMRTMPPEATPVNRAERLYVMIFMFIALAAFAICVALITQTFFKLTERSRVFGDDMSAVRMKLRSVQAPESVAMKVKSFLGLLYRTRRIHAREVNMCGHLPIHVNMMLKAANFEESLRKVICMRHLCARALRLITDMSIIRDMAPGDLLSYTDDIAMSCWVLVDGRFSVLEITEACGTLVVEDVEVVDEHCLRTAEEVTSSFTVVCSMASTVQEIRKDEFMTLLGKFPDLFQMRRSSMGSRRRSLRQTIRDVGANMSAFATRWSTFSADQ